LDLRAASVKDVISRNGIIRRLRSENPDMTIRSDVNVGVEEKWRPMPRFPYCAPSALAVY